MEIDIPSATRVEDIKDKLEGVKGARLRIKANLGRGKFLERTGTLTQIYPSLFIVEVEERRGRKARQSYQYVDILRGVVELFDTETDESLFEFAAPETDEGEDEEEEELDLEDVEE